MFTPTKLHCGFGDTQVQQIKQHCQIIFSIADVFKFVDIWHSSVAREVLFAVSTVFEDVDISLLNTEEPDKSQVDCFDWDAFLDFEVEHSQMAAIPQELWSVSEDYFNFK